MNLRYTIFIVFCIFVPAMQCFSQNDMPDRFVVVPFDCVGSGYARYADSSCIDTSYINVVYRHVFRTSEDSPSRPKDLPKQCIENLLAGKNHTLYLGHKGQGVHTLKAVVGLEKSIRHNNEVSARQQEQINSGIMDAISPFYLWILKNNVSSVQKVAIADQWDNLLDESDFPGQSEGLANFYDEPFPEFSWEITGDTAEVFGYDCIRAECDFRGRHWTAWFAPEIAVNEGPWKLRGLPGSRRKLTGDGSPTSASG